MDGSTTCADHDSKSTVDTGNLDKAGTGTYIALNCILWEGGLPGTIVQSDVRFNTYDFDFTYTPATGCSDDYDVGSTMTHELGHAHGLYDHYSSWEFYQTMYGHGDPCTSHARNLGIMDVREIRLQY